jgi:hypothetical protein
MAKWFGPVGLSLVWAKIGAELLDAVENYVLIHVLLRYEQGLFPAVAHWRAMPKFLVMGAGLFCVALGPVPNMVAKMMISDQELIVVTSMDFGPAARAVAISA